MYMHEHQESFCLMRICEPFGVLAMVWWPPKLQDEALVNFFIRYDLYKL